MITVKEYNESFIQIDADLSYLREISQYFSYYVPNYKFHPKVRKGLWDGRIKEFNMKSRLLPKGLLFRLFEFCKKRSYKFNVELDMAWNDISEEEIRKFIDTLDLPEKYKTRDYQVETIAAALRRKRATFESPTSSGKSFVIYVIMAFLGVPTLIIVPNTGLVDQMYLDFREYSMYREDWDIEEEVSKIMGGYDKYNTNDSVISTWQSLMRIPAGDLEEYLSKFEMVICDEVHLAKATEIKRIVSCATASEYKFGFTGTLDGVEVHKIMIEGLFGPVKQVITTSELIDSNTVSSIDIKLLKLEYTDEDRKSWDKPTPQDKDKKKKKESKYAKEVKFLCKHEDRNEFICNLALSLKGNTLILYNYVEDHGKPLYEMISRKTNRIVQFVDGSVKDRTAIRKTTEENDGVINVCSYGTFSTGMSITKLHNLILASPTKSRVRVLQSIGRTLRRDDENTEATIYDIADDLTVNGKKNTTLNHALERIKIYKEQRFPYKVYNIKLNKKK